MNQTYKRGDIYYADYGKGIGSEQKGYRPVVIIQNNIGNKYSSTVIVAAVSTRKETRAKLPVHCHIGAEHGLEAPSTILLEQIRTMSKKRLSRYVGRLDEKQLAEIDRALAISIGLIEPGQKRMVLNLCSVCANHFYGSNVYHLRRTDPIQVVKETCTYCNQTLGFEYELIRKIGGRGK